MRGSDTELTPDDAYRYCRQIARYHAKTFYLATRFLSKKQRNPIYAMYALLRTVDDLVDLAEEEVVGIEIGESDTFAFLAGR